MDPRYYESYRKLQDRHWWFLARSQIVTELIDAWNLVGRKGEILDIGCGPGGPLLRTLGQKYLVEGLEREASAVNFAHQQGLTCVQQGTLESYCQENHQKDLILLLDVIEHVEDDANMLRMAQKVLKSRGYLLITVPALPWLWSGHDQLAHHYRRYTLRQLKTTFKTAGLVCERISYFNTLLFPIAVVKKMVDRLRRGSSVHGYYDTPGTAINGILRAVFASEARWLKSHTFPFGVSLLAIGRKCTDEMKIA